MRYGARISRYDGGIAYQVKWVKIASPTKMIVFADVWSGYVWEKYYYNESNPYNSLGGTNVGMIVYRHGNSTVLSFADGHVGTELNTLPDESTYGYLTGVHADATAKIITGAYNVH